MSNCDKPSDISCTFFNNVNERALRSSNAKKYIYTDEKSTELGEIKK